MHLKLNEGSSGLVPVDVAAGGFVRRRSTGEAGAAAAVVTAERAASRERFTDGPGNA